MIQFFSSNNLIHYTKLILCLPFVLFFPGYALILAIFPSKNELKPIERVILSFGLSIVIVPLLGLCLNYTTWGIRLFPVTILLTTFVIITSCFAIYRRAKIPCDERYFPSVRINITPLKELSSRDKIVRVLLILSVFSVLVSVVYVVAIPKTSQNFTEFYILDEDGKAKDYPRILAVNQEGEVLASIINYEHTNVTYRIQVDIDGYVTSETGPITLEQGQKWEGLLTFSSKSPNEKLKVNFLLFRDEQEEPYRLLYLWVKVGGI